MEMAQKLCLLEMTRKFTSVIVQFRHQSAGLCCGGNVHMERDIPYLSSLKHHVYRGKNLRFVDTLVFHVALEMLFIL